MKICVLIRVYDRIKDLEDNLKIIRDTWTNNDYHLVVSSNGMRDGYLLSDLIYKLSDKVVTIEENAGHLKGNSQLLLEGLKVIDINSYDFVVILEADTWIYTDKIIKKYTKLLNDLPITVWASANWYDRFFSLATDFAIIKASFLSANNDVFNFTTYPECYVCNYILDKKYQYINIKENMNVQIPGYFNRFPYAPKGRFYCFPFSNMITHHIEDIEGGMVQKRKYFNIISLTDYFDVKEKNKSLKKTFMIIVHLLDKLMIRRTLFIKRKRFSFEKSYAESNIKIF